MRSIFALFSCSEIFCLTKCVREPWASVVNYKRILCNGFFYFIRNLFIYVFFFFILLLYGNFTVFTTVNKIQSSYYPYYNNNYYSNNSISRRTGRDRFIRLPLNGSVGENSFSPLFTVWVQV